MMSEKRAIQQNVKQALSTTVQQGMQPNALIGGTGLVMGIPGQVMYTLWPEWYDACWQILLWEDRNYTSWEA